MGAKAPRKYNGKLGLMPGYQKDRAKELELAEARQKRRARYEQVKAKRALQAQGFSFDKLKSNVRNMTGRRV